jgi:3',5'-nucleoside bisphosphate phosphatase
MRVDLHVHTSASDGQYPPEKVIALALKRKLNVIAITDHDTTDGIAQAEQAAAQFGSPVVIPGIELSAEDSGHSVHILGYFIRPDVPVLREALAVFHTDRQIRGQQMVERLAKLGAPVEWARVLALSDGGAVGRPHIARALYEAKHVESVREAFDRFLYDGGPAYVGREGLTPEDAIVLIHKAGGAAVLAHPGALPDFRVLVPRLASAGLDGLEVVHPIHNRPTRLDLRGLAAMHSLIMTGGSDFHGTMTNGTITLGSETPPEGCVAALRARVARYA